MPALGLAGEPIPLWWTGDFINASPEGTPEADEKWIIGEFTSNWTTRSLGIRNIRVNQRNVPKLGRNKPPLILKLLI